MKRFEIVQIFVAFFVFLGGDLRALIRGLNPSLNPAKIGHGKRLDFFCIKNGTFFKVRITTRFFEAVGADFLMGGYTFLKTETTKKGNHT